MTPEFSVISSRSPNVYVLMDRDFTLRDMKGSNLSVTMRRRDQILSHGMIDAFPLSTGVRDVDRTSKTETGLIPRAKAVDAMNQRLDQERRHLRFIERGLAQEMGGEATIFHQTGGVGCIIDAPRPPV